jgi:hypothetical protein
MALAKMGEVMLRRGVLSSIVDHSRFEGDFVQADEGGLTRQNGVEVWNP